MADKVTLFIYYVGHFSVSLAKATTVRDGRVGSGGLSTSDLQ